MHIMHITHYLARCFSNRARSSPLLIPEGMAHFFSGPLAPPFTLTLTRRGRARGRGSQAPELPAEGALRSAIARKRSSFPASSSSMVIAAPKTITRTLARKLP